MLQEEKQKIDHLIDHTEEYLETNQELIKLVVAEKTSNVMSTMAVSFVLFFVFCLVFIFASLALALYLSSIIGNSYSGFMAVAGLYLLLTIIFYIKRESWMKQPLMDMIIKNYFKHDDQD